MKTKILKSIHAQLEAEGCTPDHPSFEFRLLERKVETCKRLRGMRSCPDCALFMHCDMVKEYAMKVRYGNEKKSE